MNRTTVVLCGCGHVAQALIKMVKLVGYNCTVIEDRPEYAEKGRQAGADTVICGDFALEISALETDEKTFFVIMTREHEYDYICLKAIEKKKHAYVGMMGSRLRASMIRKRMAESGMSEEFLAGLHAPIGIRIHSDTPAEIAVSVMAEIIAVRAEAGIDDGDPAEFLEALSQRQIHGVRSIQAEVVKRVGSAPRGKGAKMLIDADGTCFGTVGGGFMEAQVIQRAKQILSEDLPDEIMHFSLHSAEAVQNDMYCGGEVDVKLERVK